MIKYFKNKTLALKKIINKKIEATKNRTLNRYPQYNIKNENKCKINKINKF